ncbi:MAG: methenyltetrahydromethanopterin cyclohydrolase [Planctomycetaceae bacterium]
MFQEVNCDFYQIDPMLFSPAQVVFQNIETGRVHWFGELNEKLVAKSFGIQQPAAARV